MSESSTFASSTAIQASLSDLIDTATRLQAHCSQEIMEAIDLIIDALASGHKILFIGNGGSAANAQHMAAELSGRFVIDRPGLAGIALTTDTSVLTAVSNDYGFEQIFVRQLEALAKPGDIVVGFSTSGNSPNILTAMQWAQKAGISTIGMTGKGGGKLPTSSDTCIIVPSENTARIQEIHLLVSHLICEAIDEWASQTFLRK